MARQTITKDETGTIDLAKKNAKQSIKSLSLDGNDKSLDRQEVETALIEGKLYTKMDGKWTISKACDPTASFDEKNKLKGIADLISCSYMEVTGKETVDGERCYVVRVEPEKSTAQSILESQAMAIKSSMPDWLPSININGLSDSDVYYTIWLTEDKCIPKKMDAEMTFTLASASKADGSDTATSYKIDATVEDILVLSNFDASENIAVPDEAYSYSSTPL